MVEIQRRSFVQLAPAAFPLTALAQTGKVAAIAKPVRVPAGTDREEKRRIKP
jgi:hypothetical protein